MNITLSVEWEEKIFSPQTSYHCIRLMAGVHFVQTGNKSFSENYSAIVDTGTPVSVIPYSYWKNFHIHVLGEALRNENLITSRFASLRWAR